MKGTNIYVTKTEIDIKINGQIYDTQRKPPKVTKNASLALQRTPQLVVRAMVSGWAGLGCFVSYFLLQEENLICTLQDGFQYHYLGGLKTSG